jgi:hypothetical protein
VSDRDLDDMDWMADESRFAAEEEANYGAAEQDAQRGEETDIAALVERRKADQPEEPAA